MYFSDIASAMLLNVSVDLNETPERIVTPAKESLRLKDSTVMEMSSPDMEGIKHSICDMTAFVYQRQM
jgi:hypothetical protein